MRYESEVCDCGWHSSLIVPENTFQPSTRHCPVCAGADQYHRILHDADGKAEKAMGKDPDPRSKRPADGRKAFMRLMPPEAPTDTPGGDRGDSS